METKNCCENCKFYNRYYYIYRARLVYASNGSCLNHQVKVTDSRKIIRNRLPCAYFEQAENDLPVSEETLQDVIGQMKQRLDELLMILQHD